MKRTHHSPKRVLFLLKRREDYNQDHSYSHTGVSTGLWNSARLVSEMLNRNGVVAKVVVCVDNNDIDREVTNFKPTDVIIEALWVVPEKFFVLHRLHPKVKWNVRLHSEIPFIASEGIAMKWIGEYLKFKNVTISANSKRMLEEVRLLVSEQYDFSVEEIHEKVFYLPNYYDPNMHMDHHTVHDHSEHRHHINVGCFGAVRPLKNHLMQAIAAIKFANHIGKKLHFHINIGRIEMKGEPILHNLIDLFNNLEVQGHKLVMHPWMPHHKFVDLVQKMDIGMQVTFSETFNIVAADLTANNIPMIVSKEVEWAFPLYYADPTSMIDIYEKLIVAWKFRGMNVFLNRLYLGKFSTKSQNTWVSHFG